MLSPWRHRGLRWLAPVAYASVVLTACSEPNEARSITGLTATDATVEATQLASLPPHSALVGDTATIVTRTSVWAKNHGRAVTWRSTDPSVVTVTSKGFATAVGIGSASVISTSLLMADTVRISVVPNAGPVASVTVTAAQTTISTGGSTPLTVVLRDAAGNVVTGPTVSFQSSASSIATVDPVGLVTGVAVGSASITATASGVSGQAAITVSAQSTPPSGGLGAAPNTPQLLNFTFPTVTGRTWTVNAGQSLQQALNSAQRGDEIVLQAGATFSGNYTLPAKSGTVANGWILIRSDKLSQLPPQGTRVTNRDANLMPKISTPAVAPALMTALTASGWWIAGVEITVDPKLTAQQYGILALGDGSPKQSTLASVASDLVLDRVYVHGAPNTKASRCIALNSARTQISDSYVTDCHGKAFDAQAIGAWNGPGPYKIVNNTLIASGENIMFGGADPSIANLIPSDIEMRQNYLYTPTAWKKVWLKKNLLETKNVRRLLVDGNVFDGSWADGQVGYAIVFKSANQAGRCTWCQSMDITFTNNIVRNAGAGLNLAGREGSSPYAVGGRLSRVLVNNNSVENIATGLFTGDARMVQVIDDVQDLTITNNTMDSPGAIQEFLMLGPLPAASRMSYDNNISMRGQYGLYATGRGEGTQALASVKGWTFNTNTLVTSVSKGGYPATTTFVSTMSAAKAKGGAGADMSIINARTAGVIIP